MSNIVPFQDMQQMAKAIADSKLFGLTDVNQVLALGMVAQAEGHAFATAARDYHVIQGRPALKADAMMARFQSAGGKVNWEVYTDEQVTGIFSHPNGGSLSVTWTIDQARSIGLVKPGSGWQKFPRAMLRSRCISEGIRSVYPGSVTGFYSPEEVADFDDKPRTTRDMGKLNDNPIVETVPVAVITEDGEVLDAPVIADIAGIESDALYPLYLPDGTIYSSHDTKDQWCVAYVNMTTKLFNSQKMDAGTKQHKITAFRDANEKVRTSLSKTDQIALTQMIAQHKSAAVTVHDLKKYGE
jgi:hypothetical protein